MLGAGVLSVVALLSIVYCCLGALAWCVGLVALLHFLALICVSAKNAKELPNALAILSYCSF